MPFFERKNACLLLSNVSIAGAGIAKVILGTSMEIDEFLKRVVDKGASDLHLKEPSPPVLRIDGALILRNIWALPHGRLVN